MINSDWYDILNKYGYINRINVILEKIKKTDKIVYPQFNNIFNALNLTTFKNTKVVIIGQDPYHGENEANGLAFSLNDNVKITPSLRNIYKELYNDLNIKKNNNDLSGWAKQGVLLLNTILTVEKDKPLSHKDFGWQEITTFIIKYINENKENVVFILWGNNAKEYGDLIDKNKHLVISSSHPSPFSANKGFFGSNPFSRTNKFLIEKNQSGIDWSL
jgi:uracil-DNA glycosylase